MSKKSKVKKSKIVIKHINHINYVCPAQLNGQYMNNIIGKPPPQAEWGDSNKDDVFEDFLDRLVLALPTFGDFEVSAYAIPDLTENEIRQFQELDGPRYAFENIMMRYGYLERLAHSPNAYPKAVTPIGAAAKKAGGHRAYQRQIADKSSQSVHIDQSTNISIGNNNAPFLNNSSVGDNSPIASNPASAEQKEEKKGFWQKITEASNGIKAVVLGLLAIAAAVGLNVDSCKQSSERRNNPADGTTKVVSYVNSNAAFH
jgi:hypothetical protein